MVLELFSSVACLLFFRFTYINYYIVSFSFPFISHFCFEMLLVVYELRDRHGIISGFDPAHRGDFSWARDHPKDVEVKTLHISSPILAAKSPFFYKVRSST